MREANCHGNFVCIVNINNNLLPAAWSLISLRHWHSKNGHAAKSWMTGMVGGSQSFTCASPAWVWSPNDGRSHCPEHKWMNVAFNHTTTWQVWKDGYLQQQERIKSCIQTWALWEKDCEASWRDTLDSLTSACDQGLVWSQKTALQLRRESLEKIQVNQNWQFWVWLRGMNVQRSAKRRLSWKDHREGYEWNRTCNSSPGQAMEVSWLERGRLHWGPVRW